MRGLKRWLATALVAGWACLLLGSTALAAAAEPEKEPPKLSPGMEQLLKDIRALRQSRLEQLNAEIDQLIDQAHRAGKITDEEAARLREWRAMRRMGLSPHASEAEVKEKLEQAVKNGRLTKEQARQLLKQWQRAHRSHHKARP